MDKSKEYADKIRATIKVCEAVCDAIGEAGEDGIPSGHMYVLLMEYGMSYQGYVNLIDLLISAGRIRVSHNVLYAKEKSQ